MSNRKPKARAALKPTKPIPEFPASARREVVAMARAAARAISADNPKRDVVLRGIERLCRQWKVGLPAGWDAPASPANAPRPASLRDTNARIKKMLEKDLFPD